MIACLFPYLSRVTKLSNVKYQIYHQSDALVAGKLQAI